MSNAALYQRALARVKLFFQHKGAAYKAVLAVVATALLLGVLGVVTGIFGIGNGGRDAKTIISTGDNNTVNGSQPMLPNLEYLADKNIRMAKSHYEHRNYPEALKHYEEAYKNQEKALEAAHAGGGRGDVQKKALADILVSKGVMRIEMGRYDTANKDFTEAESIYGQLSAGERDYAVIYHNRGLVFDKQGEHEKAQEWYRKALGIMEKVLGKEDPSTAMIYNNIDRMFEALGGNEGVLEWDQEALDTWEKNLPAELSRITTALLSDLGKHEEALEYQETPECMFRQ